MRSNYSLPKSTHLPHSLPLSLFSVVMVVIASDCVSLIEDEIALPPSLLCRVGVCSRFLCPRRSRALPPPPLPACLPRHLALDLLRQEERALMMKRAPPSLPPVLRLACSRHYMSCHEPSGRSVHICWDSERMSLDGSDLAPLRPSFLFIITGISIIFIILLSWLR